MLEQVVCQGLDPIRRDFGDVTPVATRRFEDLSRNDPFGFAGKDTRTRPKMELDSTRSRVLMAVAKHRHTRQQTCE